MKIVRRFIYGEDRELGGEGWLPKWIPGHADFNAGHGMLCAHDMLEHRLSDTGELHEEAMAFGTILWGRVQAGYFSRGFSRVTVEENLASDWVRLLGDENHGRFRLPPRTYRLTGDDEWADDMIREVCLSLPRSIRDEYGGEERAEKAEIRKLADWMRIGYRYAKRRFKSVSPYDLEYSFIEVSKAIDKIRGAELGEEIIVNADIGRGVHIKRVEPDYVW